MFMLRSPAVTISEKDDSWAQAVERNGKRLQVGTQSRSTQFVKDGIAHIRNGEIGEVLISKAWNSQRRGSIGKTESGTPRSR